MADLRDTHKVFTHLQAPAATILTGEIFQKYLYSQFDLNFNFIPNADFVT